MQIFVNHLLRLEKTYRYVNAYEDKGLKFEHFSKLSFFLIAFDLCISIRCFFFFFVFFLFGSDFFQFWSK